MSTIKTAAIKGLKAFFTLKPKRNPNISVRRATIGVIAVYLTQLTDFTSTYIGLSLGAVEQNPVMHSVIESGGYAGFFLAKVFLGGSILAWYSWKRKYAPWVFAAIYGGISIWNATVIIKLLTL